MVENTENEVTEEVTRTISKEVAEEQFDSFLDYYRVKFENIELENGEESAKTLRNDLVDAIMAGSLDIELEKGNLLITQVLRFPTEKTSKITFKDKVVIASMAMDGISAKKSTQRVHAFMGALSDVHASEFIRMRGSDVLVFNRLSVVFSMV